MFLFSRATSPVEDVRIVLSIDDLGDGGGAFHAGRVAVAQLDAARVAEPGTILRASPPAWRVAGAARVAAPVCGDSSSDDHSSDDPSSDDHSSDDHSSDDPSSDDQDLDERTHVLFF